MIIILPWPDKRLSPNARMHWAQLASARKAARIVGAFCAREAGARLVEARALQVTVTFHPPDNRRRDRDNLIANLKSYADGIADVLRVDDSKWQPTYLMGARSAGGMVAVEFPELLAGNTDETLREWIIQQTETAQ